METIMKKVSCATYEGIDAKVVHVESTLTKGLRSEERRVGKECRL